MKKNLHIDIKGITRVEGHGNVTIDVKKGRVKEVKLQIVESPRFFEVMLVGRRYDEAQHIMSRICGICGVSHTCASLKAIESAMGIRVSRQTKLLRKLAFCGENLQSHLLHLFFLVFPDLVGAGSISALMESHPKLLRTGLELKRAANEINTVIGGRAVHPISLYPGGFVYCPSRAELAGLKEMLLGCFDGLYLTHNFLSEFPTPELEGPGEFISLKARGEFGLYDGTPFSSKKYSIKPESYSKKIKEYIVPYSTSKQAVSRHGTFMVGALARVNNNFRQLKPGARDAAKRAGFRPIERNPFMNNMAQLIECYQFVEDAVGLIDKLLEVGVRPEKARKPGLRGKGGRGGRGGRGIGIVEAPRGILYHDYTINKDGLIERADCIIPTSKNLKSIEEEIKAYVPALLDKPKESIRDSVETLIRAYDPCISCATHFIEIDFA